MTSSWTLEVSSKQARSAKQRHHSHHTYLRLSRVVFAGAGQKNYRVEEAFAVRHFAGDVCYVGAGFCDKNNDTLHSDFVNLCSNGGHTLLAGLFAAEAGAKKANSFNSVSRRFINQLNELMVDLNATKVRTECPQHLHHKSSHSLTAHPPLSPNRPISSVASSQTPHSRPSASRRH